MGLVMITASHLVTCLVCPPPLVLPPHCVRPYTYQHTIHIRMYTTLGSVHQPPDKYDVQLMRRQMTWTGVGYKQPMSGHTPPQLPATHHLIIIKMHKIISLQLITSSLK